MRYCLAQIVGGGFATTSTARMNARCAWISGSPLTKQAVCANMRRLVDGGVAGRIACPPSRHQSNQSAREVEKFSVFARTWWNARSNPLVGMNPVRVSFIGGMASQLMQSPPHKPLNEMRVLDVGSGGGLLTESLSRLGATLVVGLDASEQVVQAARAHSFHFNSKLLQSAVEYHGGTTVEQFATQWKEKQLFDVVTCLEVIEHVPEPESLLRAAVSLLKPNGILFVSTINRTLKSYGLAILAAEYLTGKVPPGTHDWSQFRSPDEVDRMVCGDLASMKPIDRRGMVLNPPFVNMDWRLCNEDTDVNWIAAYQREENRRDTA